MFACWEDRNVKQVWQTNSFARAQGISNGWILVFCIRDVRYRFTDISVNSSSPRSLIMTISPHISFIQSFMFVAPGVNLTGLTEPRFDDCTAMANASFWIVSGRTAEVAHARVVFTRFRCCGSIFSIRSYNLVSL